MTAAVVPMKLRWVGRLRDGVMRAARVSHCERRGGRLVTVPWPRSELVDVEARRSGQVWRVRVVLGEGCPIEWVSDTWRDAMRGAEELADGHAAGVAARLVEASTASSSASSS